MNRRCGNARTKSSAWAKIVGRLDAGQQAILRSFILRAVRPQRAPCVLWIYGPAASGKSALVRAVATSLGSVVTISGCDLERGRYALSRLYDYATRKSIASLLIVNVGQSKRDLFFQDLASGEPLTIAARGKQPVIWTCDMPVIFVAKVPPPEFRGQQMESIELVVVPEARRSFSPNLFTAWLGRSVRIWALTHVKG